MLLLSIMVALRGIVSQTMPSPVATCHIGRSVSSHTVYCKDQIFSGHTIPTVHVLFVSFVHVNPTLPGRTKILDGVWLPWPILYPLSVMAIAAWTVLLACGHTPIGHCRLLVRRRWKTEIIDAYRLVALSLSRERAAVRQKLRGPKWKLKCLKNKTTEIATGYTLQVSRCAHTGVYHRVCRRVF